MEARELPEGIAAPTKETPGLQPRYGANGNLKGYATGRPVGRPKAVSRRLDEPGVIEAICARIQEGMPAKWAAIRSGVSETAFYESMAAYPAFADRIKAARAKKIETLLGHVTAAAPKNWAAAMTLLERTEPADFSRTQRVQSSVQGTVNLNVTAAQVSPQSMGHIAALEAILADEDYETPQLEAGAED
jgi:hypothetical protein